MSIHDVEMIRLPFRALAARTPAVQCRFGALLNLPDATAPRVLALSVDDCHSLAAVAAGVDELVTTPREHAFLPHVSLVRLNRPGRVLWLSLVTALSQIEVSDVDCCFDRLGLYRSDPSDDGPIYTPVLEAPLEVPQPRNPS